jgi:hypothetical protein
MARGHSFGTSIRRVTDTGRLATALTRSGIDPRYWVSYGTVATIGDDGTPDFTSKSAVYIGPEGVEADVVLEPLDVAVVAHYAGLAGGRETTFYTPLRAGDRVLVCLPDGNPMVPPVIVAVLHNAGDTVPMEGGRPIFQNDRALLRTRTVDIDIRAGGTKVEVRQNGHVTVTAPHVDLGDGSVTEQVPLGTTYRARETAMHVADEAALGAVAAPAAAWLAGEGNPAGGPFFTAYPQTTALLAAMAGAAATILSAIQSFESQAASYLSNVTKTR